MDIRDRAGLKGQADRLLASASYHPRMLALIFGGVSLGAGLLVMLLNYVISTNIQTSGGLSGLGSQAILDTLQVSLRYIVALLQPFWSIGFVFAALQMARQQEVGPKSLLEGFRRFGPVLRLRFSQGMIFLGAAIMCLYTASFLFAFTPWSAPMMEQFLPYLENGSVEELETAISSMPLEQLLPLSAPIFVIFGVLYLVVGGFLFYRFRLADLIVMDEPRMGGMMAMAMSTRLTRRRRMCLLRLDLDFWWIYLMSLVSVVIGYGDVLLPYVGVQLPVTGDAAWLVFYVLSALVQLAVYWLGYAKLHTTWAVAYDVLRQMPQEQPRMQVLTKPLPFDDYGRNQDPQ